ncbi:TPA: hypothetical protein R4S64_003679 [Kluyvera georgiana]|uniref:hypothetical protein n=1 Tax=Enterobacter hormaechei TaxID=158836 RepID=UPI00293FF0BB|nr:hypothetical protein [Kluyvera georgiana]
MGNRKTPLKGFLIGIVPVVIPAIVFIIQLSVWAALMHYGYVERSWLLMRLTILIAVGVVCFAGFIFYGSGTYGIKTTAFFVLVPWCVCAVFTLGIVFVTFEFEYLSFRWFLLTSGASISLLLISALMEKRAPGIFK